MFDSDKYIKVIGITAVLLLFGLINSVSAIVFAESSGYRARSDFRAPLKIQISSQLLRYGKNFLLTYQPYAALQNFSRALHLGEL